jgi:hypothetical protein
MSVIEFPVPVPDEDDHEWWSCLDVGVLMIARCEECGARWLRALPACPYCGCECVSLVESSGEGSVYSWVTVRRALDPAFVGEEPYTVLVVDLDDGGRINGRLLDDEVVDEDSRVQFARYCQAGRSLIGFTKVKSNREGRSGIGIS